MNETENIGNYKKEKKAKRKERLICALLIIVGIILTVIDFILYYKASLAWFTVLICIASVAYTFFKARYYLNSKDYKDTRWFFVPLTILIFYVIAFTIVAVGSAIMFEGLFLNEFFLYPIFLMPAFDIVVIIVALIGQGL